MNKLILFFILIIQFNILEANEGSVVCLHGFFRTYKCMMPMGNALEKEGFEVFLWDYPSRKGMIEDHAQNLIAFLKVLAAKKPGKPIHFTTHSLGGVIVRAAVAHPECPPEAKMGKAVLLAPPNKGAHLARKFHKCPVVSWFFGKKAGKQLLVYEEEEMSNVGSFPQSMDVMVIAGNKGHRFFKKWVNEPNDGKVTVEETRLPTPHIHRTLYVSHHWIMTSRESIAITKEFLTDSTKE